MRIMIFMLIVSIFQSFANDSYSQNTKLSLDLANLKLADAMDEIEELSEFYFLFNEKLVDTDREVSMSVENQDINEILDELFVGTDIVYTVTDRKIILAPKYLSENQQQQQNSITGKVTDEIGEPLPGVTVVIKGTTSGTISGIDGNYSIACKSGDVLVFSFIGMKSQEMIVLNQSVIDISMVTDAINISEFVAVGYGVQKKINLTGSVSSISGEELQNRPVTQVSQALAGITSGISVAQSGGQPGRDGATINIRGLGTFSKAGNAPLVLVDGLAASMDDVDPNNIESVSVLKDASSAAIYGTRAANGVILITTKQGKKGKIEVSYDSYAGWQKATELPNFVESAEYAELKNVASPGSFTESDIEHYRSGDDPDNFPNVPHTRNLLTSGSGFQTKHNISINGGNDKNLYMLSFGYLQQNGIVAENKYEKYNFLLNLKSELAENLDLSLNLRGNADDDTAPRSSEGNLQQMISQSLRQLPTIAGRKSDGTYGYQDNNAPEAWLDSESFDRSRRHSFAGAVDLNWEILPDLSLEGKAGYTYYNTNGESFVSTIGFNPSSVNSLKKSNDQNSLLTLQSILRYSKIVKDHSFSGLLGFSQEDFDMSNLYGSRSSFPVNTLYELNAGSEATMINGSTGSEWSLRSFFGRLNYNYQDKYLLEVNSRYDGTSRFPEDQRWGFFPSVSAGWKLSKETFIKDNIDWISDLKVRASWGRLGNQNVGTYPYQSVINLGYSYPIGQAVAQGAAIGQLANTNITWETTTTKDIGFDLSAYKGKFNMSFDVFNKNTTDILYEVSVPMILGVKPSEVNAGEAQTNGFELSLSYKANIGDLKIHVSPNYMYAKNEVTKLASVEKDIAKGLFVGSALNAIYGYDADGLFATQADADAANAAGYPYQAEAGFIKYKDISGPDGTPDGVVDAEYDRKVIGSTFPKHSFGMNLAFEYKGIDLSMIFHSLTGFKKLMGYYQAYAFYNNGQIQSWQADNRWTAENPDPNAGYPKLISVTNSTPLIQPSTYWLRDASFLRLENLQIGYNFPKHISERLNLARLRIYFSGQNLFSINNYYEGWDPEMKTEALNASSFYPIVSTYTFGLNVKF